MKRKIINNDIIVEIYALNEINDFYKNDQFNIRLNITNYLASEVTISQKLRYALELDFINYTCQN